MSGGHGYKCPNCGKEQSGDEVACWYCETDLDKQKNKQEKPQCFIATAVYGEHALQTNLLRRYRDNTLQRSFFGRMFIDVYYTISPPIARILQKNKSLRNMTKRILDCLIHIIKK